MCQIIAGSAHKIRSTLLNTPGLIADLYKKNSDGLGAMFRSRGGLRIVKVLPKSVEDARAMIESLPDDDRNLALHWRMQTHGLIDKLNCHPYTVVPSEVAMMHNGILSTSNKADVDKSDTWHFIKDYLVDMVKACPEVIHEPQFAKMVGDFIDYNRFVFMDANGKMSIINEDQGLWHDGMWFANTYAWNPALLIKDYRAKSQYSYAGLDDDWINAYPRATAAYKSLTAQPAKAPAALEVGTTLAKGYYEPVDGDVVCEFNTGNFDVFVQFDGDEEGYSYTILESDSGDIYDEGYGYDTSLDAEIEASTSAQYGEARLNHSSARAFIDSDEYAELQLS